MDRSVRREGVQHAQARDGAHGGVQDSGADTVLEGVQFGMQDVGGAAGSPTLTTTASARRPAARPGDLVAMYAARSSETPQVFKVVRVGAGGDLVVVAHAKPTHAAPRKGRSNAAQARQAQAPAPPPEQVVPHDLVLRELPAAREKFPCALALPRVVLLTQKHAAPHHVQVHNGTPFLASGFPFRLRDEGVRWAYASS